MSALPVPREPLSLEEAIQQMINLGEKDPLDIARKCANLHGGDWVAEQLALHWEEILSEIARQKVGNDRRAAITSIGDFARSGKQKPSKREVVLTSVYVPGGGWMGLGDATADDLAAASAYRRRLASGLMRWADWYDAVRAELVEQGVPRVRDLKGQLPPLPRPELEGGE